VAHSSRIWRRLKLRDLETLLAVAQWGSMAKAAVHLSVSQPAVSKAIADMEHVLGVRLLDRSAQGVEPTIYGRVMMKWAGAVFDDVHQGVKEIEFLADPTAGELRIGAGPPMFGGFLPAVLHRLYRRHPKIVHQVLEVSGPQRYRYLRERNIDLIVSRMDGQGPAEDIQTEPLFDDPLFVAAGTHNPWVRRDRIKLADLVNEPWTLPPPDTIFGAFVAELFRLNGLEFPHSAVVCNSIQMHNALLANGPFLGIFPRSLLHFGANWLSVEVLKVDLPTRPPPVGVMLLKNRTISPVAKIFIDCAREVAKPLTDPYRARRTRPGTKGAR
jgi:DNA-binding transcriptional LysR family regulator